MANELVYLNNVALPRHFRYEPYIPKKRISITPTISGVVTQREASTPIVHGEEFISWSCDACNKNEFMLFYELYVNNHGIIEFAGYWGEVFLVRFISMDNPKVKNRRYDLSGQFQVVCVKKDYLPVC